MSLTLPNLLSALRVGLMPLFIIQVIDGQAWKALAVFGLAGVTDLLDGFIARFYHQQSVLGAYLDPAADKLLLTSAFIMLAIPGLLPGQPIPVWITVLVIARDVLIVVVALVIYLTLGYSRFRPSRMSKWNTACQLIAVFLVLLSALDPRLSPLALAALYSVAALTTASGLDYGYRFIYRADEVAAQARRDAAGKVAEGQVDGVPRPLP